MKRTALAVTAVWLIMLITACAPTTPHASEDNFYIIVNFKTAVKSMIYEYSLGGEPMGGCEMMNSRPDRDIPEGDRVYIVFDSMRFKYPEKVGSETFSFEFYVNDGSGIFPVSPREWVAEFGGEYEFTLDKKADGYALSAEDGAASPEI